MVPLAGDTVIHAASSVTLHDREPQPVLEILKDAVPAVLGKLKEEGLTDKTGKQPPQLNRKGLTMVPTSCWLTKGMVSAIAHSLQADDFHALKVTVSPLCWLEEMVRNIIPPSEAFGYPIPLHSVPTKAPMASAGLLLRTSEMKSLPITVILFNWFWTGTQSRLQVPFCVMETTFGLPVAPVAVTVMVAVRIPPVFSE